MLAYSPPPPGAHAESPSSPPAIPKATKPMSTVRDFYTTVAKELGSEEFDVDSLKSPTSILPNKTLDSPERIDADADLIQSLQIAESAPTSPSSSDSDQDHFARQQHQQQQQQQQQHRLLPSAPVSAPHNDSHHPFDTPSASSPQKSPASRKPIHNAPHPLHIQQASPSFLRNRAGSFASMNGRGPSGPSPLTGSTSSPMMFDSPVSAVSLFGQQQQLPLGASPFHQNNSSNTSLLNPSYTSMSTSSPSLSPMMTHNLRPQSANSLPVPRPMSSLGADARKNSLPGFRGAPVGQTSDTESVLTQFDVYHQKTYLRGQLSRRLQLNQDGHQVTAQWIRYNVQLVGPKLILVPMAGGEQEVMNLEEATVEMQDGALGGSFTVNWMGANRAVFEPLQQTQLGVPEPGCCCQDWVCAIRLSCYEGSRLQEIYTSTLLRHPKFRDQVAATVAGPIYFKGSVWVKFWAGSEWRNLWVVVTDRRGEEVKKKKQGKILQGSTVRGQIHFFESQHAKKPLPFVSMFNVSQAYAVCPTRSAINSNAGKPGAEDGSLTIKLEGDVVLQRENLSPSKKGFFSSPPPPSLLAKELQNLLPTGRSMFAMFRVANATERTKLLLGTAEAFKIYGKPGPLLFDAPADPAAMNFGCMASSILQQELLIDLDAVLHLPQRGESLADVKYSYGQVLLKRLQSENAAVFNHQRRMSNNSFHRQSSMPMAGYMQEPMMMGPPSPLMMMALRSRANSGSGFLVPQPSPSLQPVSSSSWSLHPGQHSPYSGSMAGSPMQGPVHTSGFSSRSVESPYPQSSNSTDDNDGNLPTDDENDDENEDTYHESPIDESLMFSPMSAGLNPNMATRGRSGSLMAPVPLHASAGYGQGRKGSVGAWSVQGGGSPLHHAHHQQQQQYQQHSPALQPYYGAGRTHNGGGMIPGAYGATSQPMGAWEAPKPVLDLPSLHSFSDDFGLSHSEQNQKKTKLTAVVYPTQIVKTKRRQDSSAPQDDADTTPTPTSATADGHEDETH